MRIDGCVFSLFVVFWFEWLLVVVVGGFTHRLKKVCVSECFIKNVYHFVDKAAAHVDDDDDYQDDDVEQLQFVIALMYLLLSLLFLLVMLTRDSISA